MTITLHKKKQDQILDVEYNGATETSILLSNLVRVHGCMDQTILYLDITSDDATIGVTQRYSD